MKFNVELWAFGDMGKIRFVDVPDAELTGDIVGDLSLIFHYGQNDFQPIDGVRSVSVDDVIRINVGGNLQLWKVASYGFKGPFSHQDYYEHFQSMIARNMSATS